VAENQPWPTVPECPTCGLENFATLEPASGDFAAVLCGRNAVQILPAQATQLNFEELAQRLRVTGEVKFNDYLYGFAPVNLS